MIKSFEIGGFYRSARTAVAHRRASKWSTVGKRTCVILPFLLLAAPRCFAQEPPRWECYCEGKPCKCTPLPSANPSLCTIACPSNMKVTRDCACSPITGPSEEERRRQELERLKQK